MVGVKTLLAAVAAVGLAVLAAGCGSEQAVSLGKPTPATTTSQEQTGPAPSRLSLEAWFVRDGALVAARRTHAPTAAVATAAMSDLLDGPTAGESAVGMTSAVPSGTRLLGINIADGVATVDLTSEFQAGGGATSLQTRLGQVVYTLTQFPTVQKVRFRLDGTPVNVFSSEGIVLDHPVGRADYATLLPAIVVATPSAGDTVSSPVTVAGTADVFEANVSVEVLDARGKVVGRTSTTAACGTGCRGSYSVDVPFTVAKREAGTVVVHDDDAAGTGKPPHEVRVPVTLSP